MSISSIDYTQIVIRAKQVDQTAFNRLYELTYKKSLHKSVSY